jgi:hypothetical protein
VLPAGHGNPVAPRPGQGRRHADVHRLQGDHGCALRPPAMKVPVRGTVRSFGQPIGLCMRIFRMCCGKARKHARPLLTTWCQQTSDDVWGHPTDAPRQGPGPVLLDMPVKVPASWLG